MRQNTMTAREGWEAWSTKSFNDDISMDKYAIKDFLGMVI